MANKIGMFTMFSTLALGHGVDNTLIPLFGNLLEKIDKLESKQITGNYYFENEEEITVYGHEHYFSLFPIEVQEGETLDLSVTFTCDDPITLLLVYMDE